MSRLFCTMMMCALLAACANQGKARDAELARIADWLPGEYSAAQGHLLIMPVAARFIGKQVLYVERTDASRQIVAQNLYRFDKSADEKSIVQRTFGFAEPQRWARGHQRAEIFRSLVMEDVTATPPCDLVWTVEGDKFAGVTPVKACRLQRVEFDGNQITLAEGGRDAGAPLSFERDAVE